MTTQSLVYSYAFAPFFSNSLKKLRTPGPAKNTCQHSAIGKLSASFWSHTATTCEPGCAKRSVAMRLIVGHMRHTIMEEMPRVIKKGLSFSGFTKRKASLIASRSNTNISRTIAIGHIIGISWNAMRKIRLLIPPISMAIL